MAGYRQWIDRRQLSQILDEVLDGLWDEFKQAGDNYMRAVKDRTPVKTGNLKSSWRLDLIKGRKWWTARVWTDVVYAPFVEYGWTRSGFGKTWGYPGAHMLMGGWSSARRRMVRDMQNRLDMELEKALKKRGLLP